MKRRHFRIWSLSYLKAAAAPQPHCRKIITTAVGWPGPLQKFSFFGLLYLVYVHLTYLIYHR